MTGWFTEDFTLAEIKTLRAKERLPFRSHDYDGRFDIPTFDEVVALAQELGRARGRAVGVYPETKHPTYFRSIGLPLEERLLDVLTRHGWNTGASPVFIQSFEDNLRRIRPLTTVRLIRLLEGHVPGDEELREIKTYADGIGPNTRLIIPSTRIERCCRPTTWSRGRTRRACSSTRGRCGPSRCLSPSTTAISAPNSDSSATWAWTASSPIFRMRP